MVVLRPDPLYWNFAQKYRKFCGNIVRNNSKNCIESYRKKYILCSYAMNEFIIIYSKPSKKFKSENIVLQYMALVC